MFPVKKQLHNMKIRNPQKYVVNSAITERYRKSSITAMQRLLNDSNSKFNSLIHNLSVTNEICKMGSLVEKI